MADSLERLPSLRLSLLAAVVAPVAVALGFAALVGYVLLVHGTERTAERLEREVGARISAELRAWIDQPQAIVAANVDLLEAGLLPADDDDVLREHFLRQLRQSPAVSYVQLGREGDGGFVGVERNPDGTFDLEQTDRPRTGKGVYALEPGGPRLLSRVEGYDARTRPWYRSAVSADAPTWSAIYQFASTRRVRVGVTAVAPVRRPDGELLGVVGADLVLSHLSVLLRTAIPSPGSQILLVERDGEVVASTTEPTAGPSGAPRVAARDSVDPLIRAAVAALSPASVAGPTAERLTAPDAFAYAAPVGDGRGIDWVLVVVVPAADVLDDVDRLVGWGAVLTVGVLAVAIAIGAALIRSLTGPISVLSSAALALALDDRGAPLPEAATRELAILSNAFRDMRERVARSLDEAWRAQRSAEIANRAKSTFLANMSHELRTPLNAVVGYTELMLETLPDADPDELQADLDRVRSSARHLLGLINDLLDLARIESGRVEMRIEAVPVGPLLREVADALAPEVLRRGNRFEVEVDPTVGAASADGGRLRQVLINLVGNAAKFTEGGVVRLVAHADQPGVVIRVTDTGIGIPEQHLVSIFQPFVRLDTTDGREGAGLGLAIVARFVKDMGGKVSVKSAVGRGTEFTVVLPQAS